MKFISSLLLGASVCVLCGCGSSDKNSTSSTGGGGPNTPNPTPSPQKVAVQPRNSYGTFDRPALLDYVDLGAVPAAYTNVKSGEMWSVVLNPAGVPDAMKNSGMELLRQQKGVGAGAARVDHLAVANNPVVAVCCEGIGSIDPIPGAAAPHAVANLRYDVALNDHLTVALNNAGYQNYLYDPANGNPVVYSTTVNGLYILDAAGVAQKSVNAAQPVANPQGGQEVGAPVIAVGGLYKSGLGGAWAEVAPAGGHYDSTSNVGAHTAATIAGNNGGIGVVAAAFGGLTTIGVAPGSRLNIHRGLMSDFRAGKKAETTTKVIGEIDDNQKLLGTYHSDATDNTKRVYIEPFAQPNAQAGTSSFYVNSIASSMAGAGSANAKVWLSVATGERLSEVKLNAHEIANKYNKTVFVFTASDNAVNNATESSTFFAPVQVPAVGNNNTYTINSLGAKYLPHNVVFIRDNQTSAPCGAGLAPYTFSFDGAAAGNPANGYSYKLRMTQFVSLFTGMYLYLDDRALNIVQNGSALSPEKKLELILTVLKSACRAPVGVGGAAPNPGAGARITVPDNNYGWGVIDLALIFNANFAAVSLPDGGQFNNDAYYKNEGGIVSVNAINNLTLHGTNFAFMPVAIRLSDHDRSSQTNFIGSYLAPSSVSSVVGGDSLRANFITTKRDLASNDKQDISFSVFSKLSNNASVVLLRNITAEFGARSSASGVLATSFSNVPFASLVSNTLQFSYNGIDVAAGLGSKFDDAGAYFYSVGTKRSFNVAKLGFALSMLDENRSVLGFGSSSEKLAIGSGARSFAFASNAKVSLGEKTDFVATGSYGISFVKSAGNSLFSDTSNLHIFGGSCGLVWSVSDNSALSFIASKPLGVFDGHTNFFDEKVSLAQGSNLLGEVAFAHKLSETGSMRVSFIGAANNSGVGVSYRMTR